MGFGAICSEWRQPRPGAPVAPRVHASGTTSGVFVAGGLAAGAGGASSGGVSVAGTDGPAVGGVSDSDPSGGGRKGARRLPVQRGVAGRQRAQSRSPFRRPLFDVAARRSGRSGRRALAGGVRPCAAFRDQPHLESPQLRQVMHPSTIITALVWHRAQSTASGGNSPSLHPSLWRISSMWRCWISSG